MTRHAHPLPFGAELQPDGTTRFRLWAPEAEAVMLDVRGQGPALMGEWLRRVSSSQEATVEAALTGNRDKVVEAMLLDPLAGHIDFDRMEQMTDELLRATARWLPQFA